jgi:hypothetical protein
VPLAEGRQGPQIYVNLHMYIFCFMQLLLLESSSGQLQVSCAAPVLRGQPKVSLTYFLILRVYSTDVNTQLRISF